MEKTEDVSVEVLLANAERSRLVIKELLTRVHNLEHELDQANQTAEARGDFNRFVASRELGHFASDKQVEEHYKRHGGPEKFRERTLFLKALGHICLGAKHCR